MFAPEMSVQNLLREEENQIVSQSTIFQLLFFA